MTMPLPHLGDGATMTLSLRAQPGSGNAGARLLMESSGWKLGAKLYEGEAMAGSPLTPA